jgi:hypothetical protein
LYFVVYDHTVTRKLSVITVSCAASLVHATGFTLGLH